MIDFGRDERELVLLDLAVFVLRVPALYDGWRCHRLSNTTTTTTTTEGSTNRGEGLLLSRAVVSPFFVNPFRDRKKSASISFS